MQTAGLYLLAAAGAAVLLRMLASQSRSAAQLAAGLTVLAGSLAALSSAPAGPAPPGSSLYQTLAAPATAVAESAGLPRSAGFAVFNITLLVLAAIVLLRQVSTASAVLLAAGPILWWIDKPYPDVFTFALLTAAVALAGRAPWWIPAALAVAALVQHPLTAVRPTDIHLHVPIARELLSPAVDPNIGIFVHAPFLTLALVAALVLALVRAPGQVFSAAYGIALLTGGMAMLAFTQVPNVNAGGTPGPSRAGLWLLPLSIPLLQAAAPAAAVRFLAACALVWSVVFFAPARPGNHLRPTPLAAALWQRWPSVDNPLVEVFAERVSNSEPAPAPPLATPGCDKILIVGRGSGSPTRWPARCVPAEAPPFCREPGTLCYANRSATGYGFVKPPETWPSAAVIPVPGPADARLMTTVPPGVASRFTSLTMTAGWSYLESDGTVHWRWMGDQAEIVVAPRTPVTIRLRVEVGAFAKPRRLLLSIAPGDIATWTVPMGRTVFETGPVDLVAGPNVIRFESIDGADRPPTDDRRRLAFAVYGLGVIVE